MKTFDKAVEKHFDKLELFVPVVDRVHGEHHPDFKQLRKISDDYTVPGDVCESYEAVFQMVSELDQAYREQ